MAARRATVLICDRLLVTERDWLSAAWFPELGRPWVQRMWLRCPLGYCAAGPGRPAVAYRARAS
jgi:hypothetical protein